MSNKYDSIMAGPFSDEVERERAEEVARIAQALAVKAGLTTSNVVAFPGRPAPKRPEALEPEQSHSEKPRRRTVGVRWGVDRALAAEAAKLVSEEQIPIQEAVRRVVGRGAERCPGSGTAQSKITRLARLVAKIVHAQGAVASDYF